MSFRLTVLNAFLRWVEKPRLARASDPVALRRGADFKARLWLHAPRGTAWTCQSDRGLDLHWVVVPRATDERVILYLHGGAYVFGSVRTHRAVLGHMSRHSGHVVVMPDYRLAPEHPFPAAIEDARRAYALLLEAGYQSKQIIVGGDSAGGGLALALLGQLIAEGADLPAGVFAFSPLTDMTFSGSSLGTNSEKDVLLPGDRASLCAEFYLAGHDPNDPRASPLYADMVGAPPVYLAVSEREILRDDTLRMVETLEKADVRVTLERHERAPHAWPVFHGLIPEAGETGRRVAAWIRSL
ncbi:MAG: alpha/beta hydrolase [Pseudopelagicola sp.]|nr:alpha/beta hydrolase [Pseudopelagicola sp.]